MAAILCTAVLTWLGVAYLIPAPPSQIIIAASPQGEHYHVLGTRYQGILAGTGIKVDLRETGGAKENLKLLNDPNSGIQIGFMQGGISNGRLASELMSLGRIDHQVFWLFTVGDTLTDLSQLRGKRIGLGAEGSGDRTVCEKILAVAGITYDNTTLVSVAPETVIDNPGGGGERERESPMRLPLACERSVSVSPTVKSKKSDGRYRTECQHQLRCEPSV